MLSGTLPYEDQTHTRTQAECGACTQAECAPPTIELHPSYVHLFLNVQLALYFGGKIPLVDVLSFKILLIRVGEMVQQLRAFVYLTGTQVWSPASTWWLICHSISGGYDTIFPPPQTRRTHERKIFMHIKLIN